MTTNASRAPIDFDAFEREMQSSTVTEQPTQPPKSDPLAELARIVGQDDPFRELLESRGRGRSTSARVEPSFEEQHSAPVHHGAQTPADAFDQYLASVEQSHRADHDPAAFESDDRSYENAAAVQPPRRGRLMQVGAGLGVFALCVTGALAYKGMHGSGASGPVTVLADKTPLKVAPEKADGVDIPDQNKQIYDRTAKDGQIKIVNREEQPLDVSQATRSASRDAGAQGTTPGGGLLTESLGEPRRIRTVAVKPDTPPPAMQQQRETQAQAESARAPVSPIPTMMMPDGSNDAHASHQTVTPAAASAPRRPTQVAAAQPTPAETALVEATETPAADTAPAKSARRTLKRVASVGEPEAAIASEAPAATPSTTASIGGFSVQLGVRNSEADARAAFKQMQAKYSQLSGKPELIRQAEVNGQSLYRVRVGPLEKSAATSLCTELKSAGGQCFVAKN